MRQVVLVEMTRTHFCPVVQSSWNVYRNPRCAVRGHIIPLYFLFKTKIRGLLSLLLSLVVVFQATLYNSTRTKHPVFRHHL